MAGWGVGVKGKEGLGVDGTWRTCLLLALGWFGWLAGRVAAPESPPGKHLQTQRRDQPTRGCWQPQAYVKR